MAFPTKVIPFSATCKTWLDNTYAAKNHNHDTVYSKLGHKHEIADINGLSSKLAVLDIMTSLRGSYSQSYTQNNCGYCGSNGVTTTTDDNFITRSKSGGCCKDPSRSLFATWTMPRTVMAVDTTTGYYQIVGLYCALKARGVTQQTIEFKSDTKINMKTKTVTNVYINGSATNKTFSSNETNFIYATSGAGGSYNSHYIKFTAQYTEENIIFKATVFSYGEEYEIQSTCTCDKNWIFHMILQETRGDISSCLLF